MSAMVPPDRHNLEVEVEEAFVLYGAQQHANFPQVNSKNVGLVYHSFGSTITCKL